jgi:hypothetical protein
MCHGHTRIAFCKTEPTARATYDRLIEVARAFGLVTEDPKKTSIHLVRHAAFAGVAMRRSSLILTLKSARDIHSRRIQKREQTSANRWHLERACSVKPDASAHHQPSRLKSSVNVREDAARVGQTRDVRNDKRRTVYLTF